MNSHDRLWREKEGLPPNRENEYLPSNIVAWLKKKDNRAMFEFYRHVGKDKEYEQVERAFTYGMGLNRQAKRPMMSFRD